MKTRIYDSLIQRKTVDSSRKKESTTPVLQISEFIDINLNSKEKQMAILIPSLISPGTED